MSRYWSVLGASILISIAALLICPLIGPTPLDFSKIFTEGSLEAQIFWLARLPRVLLALLAGGALASAGVLFQALMRDALATPDTLGVSSGASLGAVVAICFGWADSARLGGLWTASLLGAGIVLMIVVGLSSSGRNVSSFTLLLAGITINSMCVAIMLFLQSVTSLGRSLAITRWLMGGVDAVEYRTLGLLSLFVLPAAVVLIWRSQHWNLLAVGEGWASAKGLDTRSSLRLGYAAGSILAGSVTAITGPIGFAGLIVPHALRMLIGPDHRLLLPTSFLLGGAFLAVCDAIGRTVFAPAELPVGVITALLGGPFFLWVLTSRATIKN
ncbi:MAG: iron ABC transporter permease [Acidobacteria bacterium]|nr:iron ABC transporter permease [Acidobacteriota bacterium]